MDKKAKLQKLKKWLYAAGTLLVIAYLVVAGIYTHSMVSEQRCRGVIIEVIDSANQKFVTPRELANELGDLSSTARTRCVKDINTDSLELLLRVIDKIESVDIKRHTDGKIYITIEPMRPVMRVFEPSGSYYINKDGKRISANARYHVDVPVLKGNFTDTTFTAVSLLPLVQYISGHERWKHLVSMIEVQSPRDVYVIPAIRGLVFNIGSPDNFDSKFRRLEQMLDDVLPTKGWEYYDTISVKWRGQIVATHRHKVPTDNLANLIDEPESDDINTMSVGDNVAAGQALPGRKANNEKPIPAAAKADSEAKAKSEADKTADNPTDNKKKQI